MIKILRFASSRWGNVCPGNSFSWKFANMCTIILLLFEDNRKVWHRNKHIAPGPNTGKQFEGRSLQVYRDMNELGSTTNNFLLLRHLDLLKIGLSLVYLFLVLSYRLLKHFLTQSNPKISNSTNATNKPFCASKITQIKV